eukprot:CAMPEP_0113309876 /NCGR_PEP_ID=MMETSP0010_2-20120614/7740_1 /TAXON_ID=216773 ORGANISM="Corethron hystrix, Strain 308" /NCGR_SAMPLE_ID=MMETSP0010_2 /ASSEMBLY_ACC=CAM_ASM_000155 /LENGTH=266 /DNA_ID=CAMNT_0000165207 /DNA_START=26 /DNA_END=826 /DNA_ORIENTATION=+ /assembly_acc=CAM_ASM_000155
MSTTTEAQTQLLEYEQQLQEVDVLIQTSSSPDENFTKLRSDLIELISLTKAIVKSSGANSVTHKQSKNNPTAAPSTIPELFTGTKSSSEKRIDISSSSLTAPTDVHSLSVSKGLTSNSEDPTTSSDAISQSFVPSLTKPSSAPAATAALPDKFLIPEKLLPLESDSDAVKEKKRRKIKTLKSKFNEKKKEEDRAKKQATWKDFISTGGGKKKKKKGAGGGSSSGLKGIAKTESMFRTGTEINAKVGVVGSGRSMTDYGERKRFKMG